MDSLPTIGIYIVPEGYYHTCTKQAHEVYLDLSGERSFAEDAIESGRRGGLSVTYTTEMPPFCSFSSKQVLNSVCKALKYLLSPTLYFSLFLNFSCHHCLASDRPQGCLVRDFLVLKYLEVIEQQATKDSLSLGDALPECRVLYRGVWDLELCLSCSCACFCVRNRRAGAGEQCVGSGCGRSGASVGKLTELVYVTPSALSVKPACFCGLFPEEDVLLECKEILYSELKWSDVPHLQVKCSFCIDLTRCSAMWWIDVIHEMWHVSVKIMLKILILGLLVWNKTEEEKIGYCRKISNKHKKGAFVTCYFNITNPFFPRSFWFLGPHSVWKLCDEQGISPYVT